MADENTPQSEYASEKLDDSQSHLRQAGEDLKEAAGAKTDDLKSKANSKMDDLKGKANDLKAAATAKVEDFKGAASAKVDDLKGVAAAKADELRTAATAKANEYYSVASDKAEEFRGQAEAAWGDAKVKARTYHEDGEEYVRENPTRALLMAVGAGFILGLIVRK